MDTNIEEIFSMPGVIDKNPDVEFNQQPVSSSDDKLSIIEAVNRKFNQQEMEEILKKGIDYSNTVFVRNLK